MSNRLGMGIGSGKGDNTTAKYKRNYSGMTCGIDQLENKNMHIAIIQDKGSKEIQMTWSSMMVN